MLTAVAFELDHEDGRSRREPGRTGYNGCSVQECWERGVGGGMPIVDRIDSFVYLATVDTPVQDPIGMEAMQHLQPLKASLEGGPH